MSIEDVDGYDAALLLEGFADLLEMLPPLNDRVGTEMRAQMIPAARSAAALVAGQQSRSQSYEAARDYVGGEWANSVLLAVVGAEEAARLMERKYRGLDQG
jgi:hypothetical protein